MIGIHIVRVGFFRVDADGNKIDVNATSIKTVMTTSSEHRVFADSAIPNSANNPTVKDYLEAEADDDFVLHYMDQNIIVTYDQSDMNAV